MTKNLPNTKLLLLMKNFKNLVSLFLLITSFSFISCENEPVDSTILYPNATTGGNTGGSGGGTGGGGGVSTGDYWPATINNSWTFSTDGATPQEMKMISTSVSGGNTYYNFNNVFGQGAQVAGTAAMGLRKNAGNYYIKLYSTTINVGGGITANQEAFEYIILKDYLSTGQTWTGVYTQNTSYTGSPVPLPSVTTTVNYTGTILGTGLTETVDGETYQNVIKFKFLQEVSIPGMPTPTTTESIYWFAKDVGPIKTEMSSLGTVTTTILTDYLIN